METIENTAIPTTDQVKTGEAKKTMRLINLTPQPKSLGLFSIAEVLAVFSAEFMGEHVCRLWVLSKLHRDHQPCCPGCGEPVAAHLLHSFWNNGRVRCSKCRKYFTALTGTFLSGCHLGFREVMLLALLLALDVPDKQIASTIKMSAENVRLWRLKLNG